MTNPQDNPRTPPPPTPSNSATPPPPSTSPKPRLRRVKMLAWKTVASGALSKKLNEKLKASQVQKSDSNSNSEDVELSELRRSGEKKKSKKEKREREGACGEDRGNGKRVVDHSPTAGLSVPAICGAKQENVEESGKKSGGSGSGEAAEGLVNLSAQGDEPGLSTEETLTDLLKKVGTSYDPKKRRTPTPKSPSAAKPSMKRKASSPTTTETSCLGEEPQEAG
ncbi:PREDICTED: WASH complex subunit FAM21 homolog [Nicotiana attenuata]|uniref:WASH complex subunit FAM21 homolog n=1 Tax=Nicotiana attenuata TaxID=49451 RepID=UPI0009053B14|nr:PREDICTED: WASH complex subunit FAM21 homolog [Nicotiana attenuata]